MTPLTGAAMYVILWWLMLFMVLPFFTKPKAAPDDSSGWRGVPQRPPFLRIVIVTTLVAGVVWLGADTVIRSDWMSFRSGYWALPSD